MEAIIKLWCYNQVNGKKCSIGGLNQDAGDIAKYEEFKASIGSFSRFKSHCKWHSIAESKEATSADKDTVLLSRKIKSYDR